MRESLATVSSCYEGVIASLTASSIVTTRDSFLSPAKESILRLPIKVINASQLSSRVHYWPSLRKGNRPFPSFFCLACFPYGWGAVYPAPPPLLCHANDILVLCLLSCPLCSFCLLLVIYVVAIPTVCEHEGRDGFWECFAAPDL